MRVFIGCPKTGLGHLKTSFGYCRDPDPGNQFHTDEIQSIIKENCASVSSTHTFSSLSSGILKMPLFSISTYPQHTFSWTSMNKHSLSAYARLSHWAQVLRTSNDTPLPAKQPWKVCFQPTEGRPPQSPSILKCLLFWLHAHSLTPIFKASGNVTHSTNPQLLP